ncbi:MAG: Gfo/Idh/MocA family protein [Actinomycetota bacterium]
MSKINVGVVSFAHGHVNAYCNQMKDWDDVRLVAAWDDNEERGRAQSDKFDMAYSPHLEDVLDRHDIDAVIITSETNRHAEHVIAAAERGKHLLLQKPMALTLEDCDRIIAAVERAGVTLRMAFQMRCDPVNQRMKQLIDDGALGKVGTLRRRHCLSLLFKPEFFQGLTRWHVDPVANKGMFMDDAVHAADFLYWFLGKPISVMAEIDNVLTDVAPDDTGMAIYRFADGAFGLLYNASVTLGAEITTEIYSDRGALQHYYADGVSTPFAPADGVPLKLFRRDQPPAWEEIRMPIPKTHSERIAAVPRPWIDQLKAEAAPDCDARGGKVSTAMCLAAYESSATGRRIPL